MEFSEEGIQMIVVGGCYRELCESPAWDALLGSGGRSALVLAGLALNTRLVTYRARNDLYHIEVHGVEVEAQSSGTEVVFSYLHPLSRPVIAPNVIPQEKPLIVDGEVILRFGFMEGDAVVTAKRAVYDPQSSHAAHFSENGSKAEQLAVVLNESELRKFGKSEEIHNAAHNVLKFDDAEVVVAKCGVHGAWIFTRNETPQWIPAYRSSSIFKIGTGDVFSAVFAHHWGVQEAKPVDAAIAASRSVAAYAESRVLPLARAMGINLPPVCNSSERVVVVGDTVTLADRWLREEALSRLMELGIDARATTSNELPRNENVLLLADGLSSDVTSFVSAAAVAGLFVVVFQQRGPLPPECSPSVRFTDDFATALYWIGWGKA